ncbi:MerR family transcriptional regulator [Salaquimonas pukyongi]|uniref:MerR family transcriptional regulator n=1 Tax=Salaquimonas pukyongi TaxID=2712698 RepID=UPI00096B9A92|nr:MerR family transcriptional regulator [Salaquimonas pukyongi]
MLAIGKAAELSGVNIETIRYYEREGVVPKPERTVSGRRIYSKADIDRLRFIKRCRELGLPICEAKSLLGLAGKKKLNCASARSIATDHLSVVRRKIVELGRMETALQNLIVQCEENDRNCPIIDELLAD